MIEKSTQEIFSLPSSVNKRLSYDTPLIVTVFSWMSDDLNVWECKFVAEKDMIATNMTMAKTKLFLIFYHLPIVNVTIIHRIKSKIHQNFFTKIAKIHIKN